MIAFHMQKSLNWSLAARSRSGTGVRVVAALTVLALQVRLVDIWNGGFGA